MKNLILYLLCACMVLIPLAACTPDTPAADTSASDTTAPGTPADTAAPTDEAPSEPAERKGCGAALGLYALLTSALAAAWVLKRRDTGA